MDVLLAALLIFLAIGQIVALGAILTRHAIPRAPSVFHSLVVGPMVISSVAAVLMSAEAVTGSGEVWGVSLDAYRTVFFAAEGLTFWTLNVYAFYYHVSGRYR